VKFLVISRGLLNVAFAHATNYFSLLDVFQQASSSGSRHVAIVISPLRSLMIDQVRRCTESGIKAVILGPPSDMSDADKQSRHTSI
jgi:hypothetical protein